MGTELEVQVAKPHVVTITVNERSVEMTAHQATGLEIKQAALAQGVPIQPDFVLSLELGGRRTRVIGDNEEIELHPNQRFVAVAPDDNS